MLFQPNKSFIYNRKPEILFSKSKIENKFCREISNQHLFKEVTIYSLHLFFLNDRNYKSC